MRIIVSPAKRMNVDLDSLDYTALPQFLEEATVIQQQLQAMSAQELQALWQCNPAIAALNVERLRGMDLQKNLTPAILAFEGIQYQYMAPAVFEYVHFDYINKHLRILSGFYGLLRPLDGVVPYRLEMQAKLSVAGCKDLYSYWGDKLARQLVSESDLILNLASQEYGRAVEAHLPAGVSFVTCVFGQWQDGKIKQKATLCKMARGQMVRFLAEAGVTSLNGVKDFNRLGYAYAPQYSTPDKLVFVQPVSQVS